MQSKNNLLKLYTKAKDNKEYKKYYSFQSFVKDAKDYIKDIKKRNTICTINPSKSGMSRTFNFDKYNMLLNICYNGTMNYDKVKVSGCGMDMHWYLKFVTAEQLLTKKEIEKYNINSLCSSGKIL
jgi:hypothetical protein